MEIRKRIWEELVTASVGSGLNWSDRLPPLESGDRLSRLEFERRYTAMP